MKNANELFINHFDSRLWSRRRSCLGSLRSQGKTLTYLFAKNISSFLWFYRVQGLRFLFIVLLLFLLASFSVRLKVYLRKALGTRLNGDDDEEMKMRSTKEDAYHLCTVHEVVTVLHGIWHAISRFGRHLGPAWHILPRSHVFSFSHPVAGIYFVTLVHRWNVGDFLFTTGLFIVFLAVFN